MANSQSLCYYCAMPKTEHDISSFAAPSEEDLRRFRALPESEQRALLEAQIAKGRASGTTVKTIEELWGLARRRAKEAAEDAL